MQRPSCSGGRGEERRWSEDGKLRLIKTMETWLLNLRLKEEFNR
jgi:hypothetical protein